MHLVELKKTQQFGILKRVNTSPAKINTFPHKSFTLVELSSEEQQRQSPVSYFAPVLWQSFISVSGTIYAQL